MLIMETQENDLKLLGDARPGDSWWTRTDKTLAKMNGMTRGRNARMRIVE